MKHHAKRAKKSRPVTLTLREQASDFTAEGAPPPLVAPAPAVVPQAATVARAAAR